MQSMGSQRVGHVLVTKQQQQKASFLILRGDRLIVDGEHSGAVFPKSGPQISSIHITWELVRSINSQMHPRCSESEETLSLCSSIPYPPGDFAANEG